MLKKLFPLVLAVLILISVCGCETTLPKKGDKLNIICTVFPLYDWTREITGSSAEVSLLLKNGTDMHSYQPSAADLVKIVSSDVVIYIGGESDKWIEKALDRSPDTARTEIRLMDYLGDNAIAEEEEHHHHDTEYDEHVWLSLKNAALFTEKIEEELSAKDKANAETYRLNANNYAERLSRLYKEYENVFNESPVKSAIFADRYPFAYLFSDYGVTCYAAFPGCSAETEASFETVISLAQKADGLNLKYIFTTESPLSSVAETIKENTKHKNQKILRLNSMQSVTKEQINSGTTYVSLSEYNLAQLKKAFSGEF